MTESCQVSSKTEGYLLDVGLDVQRFASQVAGSSLVDLNGCTVDARSR